MSTMLRAKDPDVPATYEIIIWESLVRAATRSYDFAVNDIVHYPRDTGLNYLCTVAGRTSSYYPERIPRAAGETVLDGSAEFTAKLPSDTTPPAIDSVVWTVPAALTVDSQEEDNNAFRVTLSGGVAGESYDITARVTPTVGTARDMTFTIPVAEQ